jgi:hypothetical protein
MGEGSQARGIFTRRVYTYRLGALDGTAAIISGATWCCDCDAQFLSATATYGEAIGINAPEAISLLHGA